MRSADSLIVRLRWCSASALRLCECTKAFHIDCLQPPLQSVPAGSWVCPACTPSGSTGPELAVAGRQSDSGASELLHAGRRLRVVRDYDEGGRPSTEVTGVIRVLDASADKKSLAYVVDWSDGQSEELTRAQAGQRVRRYACDSV